MSKLVFQIIQVRAMKKKMEYVKENNCGYTTTETISKILEGK
jgi:hypothetical protein